MLQHTQLHTPLISLFLLGATLIGQDSVLFITFQVLFEVLAPQCTCDRLAVTNHPCSTLGVGLLFRDPVDLTHQIPEGILNILRCHSTSLNVCDLYTMLNAVRVTILLTKLKGLIMFDLPSLSKITLIPDEYKDDTGVSLRPDLLHPLGYVLKALSIGDVVNQHSADRILEVQARDGLETFLPSCVPDLCLHILLV